MAITHSSLARNALADQINSLVNSGSGPGIIVFQTSGDVEVATCTFADPAFSAASGGAITANAITEDENATGGTIAKFTVRNSSGNNLFSGTVTTEGGGGDIEISSLVIEAGGIVFVESFIYNAPV